MRTTICSGVLAISLLVPAMASAQAATPAPAAPAPAAPASEETLVLRPTQLLAIGAGVVVGALVAEVAVPTRLGLLAGAVIGGYLGDFWYTGSQLEFHVTAPKT